MGYNYAMDRYTAERWVLESHAAMIRTAEARARLTATRQPEPVSSWLAVQLRRLADRLDGRPQNSPAHFLSNSAETGPRF